MILINPLLMSKVTVASNWFSVLIKSSLTLCLHHPSVCASCQIPHTDELPFIPHPTDRSIPQKICLFHEEGPQVRPELVRHALFSTAPEYRSAADISLHIPRIRYSYWHAVQLAFPYPWHNTVLNDSSRL